MLTMILLVVFLSIATAFPQQANDNHETPINDTAVEYNQTDPSEEQTRSGFPQALPPLLLSQKTRSDGNITILKSEFLDNGDGNFRWAFETSDGFKAEQMGVPGKARTATFRANLGGSMNETEKGERSLEEEGGEEVIGSYSYRAPDGQNISVTYTAGVDGFRPKGTHIPTLPPTFASRRKAENESPPVKSNASTQENLPLQDDTAAENVLQSNDSSMPPQVHEEVTTS